MNLNLWSFSIVLLLSFKAVWTLMPSQRFFPRPISSMKAKGSVDARLSDLGILLPPPGQPKANYCLVSRDGNLMYLSGHLPIKADGHMITGKLACEGSPGLSIADGYEAAWLCALNIVSTLKIELDGDLDRVLKVVKVSGFVACSENFHEHHLVMNGASDALSKVFGKDRGGVHARTSIGTNALPLGVPVEVEAIIRFL
jgi:enamine deaminase RidA (YjgF/YER057c/UK114 family)